MHVLSPKAIFPIPREFELPSAWWLAIANALALLICTVLHRWLGRHFPSSAAYAVLMLVLSELLFVRRLGRHHPLLHPRHRAAMRTGFLAFVVFMICAVGSITFRFDPLAASDFDRGALLPLAASAVLSFAMCPLATAIARRVGHAASIRFSKALWWLAAVSTPALALVTVVGIARCAGRPDPDNYVHSLPNVGDLACDDQTPLLLDGVLFAVTDSAHDCPSGKRLEAAGDRICFPCRNYDRVSVSKDTLSGIFVVAVEHERYIVAWVEGGKGFVHCLTPSDVSKSLSPPRGWVVFGVCASLASLVLLAVGRRHARPHPPVGGDADGRGRIMLPDGLAFTLRPGIFTHEGPVTARLSGLPRLRRGGPYRVPLPERTAVSLWAAPCDQVREWICDEAAELYAVAVVLNLFAVSPLLVAALVWLVA